MQLVLSSEQDKLRLKGIMDGRLYAGPRYLTFDITDVCNINCLYCLRHSPLVKTKGFKHLPFSLIKRTLKEAHSLGVRMVTISGDGEPLLHPHITYIIDYVNTLSMDFRIATNVTVIKNKDIISRLLSARFIEINLAAGDSEGYARMQSPCSRQDIFKGVLRNISRIVAARGKAKEPEIAIDFVLTNQNLYEIGKVFAIADRLGVDRVFSTPIIRQAKELRRLELSEKDIRSIKRIVSHYSCRYPHLRCNLGSLAAIKSASSGWDIKRCYWGWFNLFISSKGNVGPCCSLGNITFGNIIKQSLREIWESKKLHQFRLKCKYALNVRKEYWQACRFCDQPEFNKQVDNLLRRK